MRAARRLATKPLPEVADGGQRLLEASRSRLRYWDISEQQIDQLEQTGLVTKTLTLYSPYGGIVTMKKALQGMRVMAGEELLQIADLSRVWVNAEIYEQDLPWVNVGQQATVELPYAAGPGSEGQGRLYLPVSFRGNAHRQGAHRLRQPRPGTEARHVCQRADCDRRRSRVSLAIPSDAVLRSGQGAVVFVARGDGKFDPRPVETGADR